MSKLEGLDIRIFQKPEASVIKMIDDILIAFNEKEMATTRKSTAMMAYDRKEFVGGISFRCYEATAIIDYLAVKEKWRGQGIGLRLLKDTEREVRSYGGHHITVESMAYQAPDFYRKYGFQDIASVPNYYDRHTRFILRKILTESTA